MDYYVGIDLGGTNTKIGVVDKEGNKIFTTTIKTESIDGYEISLNRIADILKENLKEYEITLDKVGGVGIGVPGPVVQTRIVKFFANFPWPENLNLAEEFEKRIGLKVRADNDVNVITLGEMWKGAGKGHSNVLGIAIGTGIGGGIILNGQLVSGKNGTGGEIGHTKLVRDGKLCGCGQKGCWEAYASATGLIREAQGRLIVNKKNQLYEMTKGRELEAKDVFDAAKAGDKFSVDIVDYEAEYLAMGISNLLNTLDPEIVVLGGGVSLAGDFLIDRVKESLKKYALPSALEGLKIVQAELGNDAGILGAAYLAMM
ncbi:Glucokinase [Sebaldella termitidis]|uniref:Glucokinase n=1 Tax=Sebaldella termitidis (strain ATCC 33386 / NCTC 11300) TaxID=526218 RepID=D1AP80_SEBTE|nr:ROK family glucokinase [Sebaldella termitidis]ACZ09914.1 glucokinase, ROK family [Sebaldella termitidis ATCC 33386]SUI25245.1 Glucokinase [Sebaldella termitidis]